MISRDVRIVCPQPNPASDRNTSEHLNLPQRLCITKVRSSAMLPICAQSAQKFLYSGSRALMKLVNFGESFFTESIHCQYSLLVFTDSIHWEYSLPVFTASIHWQYSLRVFTDSIHWEYSLTVFTDSIYWQYSLRVFTESIHWQYSLTVFTDSIY